MLLPTLIKLSVQKAGDTFSMGMVAATEEQLDMRGGNELSLVYEEISCVTWTSLLTSVSTSLSHSVCHPG